MSKLDCARNVKNCALKGLLATLAREADDDREALSSESWDEMLTESLLNGDEFNYDGPITSVATNSVCF